MTLIKSISGIRGTIGGPAGENLTPPDVVKFTTAYVRLIARRNPGKKLTIVVGRDARISGEMVSNLVEGTLLACGADVVNVGLCTTPGTEMAVIGKKADGGAEEGVKLYIEKLAAELSDTMAMCGAASIKDINRSMLYRPM